MNEKANKLFLTISLLIATFMQSLDTTIASIALPNIQGNLSASQEEISWVLTSYITSSAIAILPTSWMSGKFGSKKILIFSVLGFTVTSILCGASSSIGEIVLFRTLQGIFGASLIPLSQSTLLMINPPEKHGTAMAIWGMGIMIGPILGPSLGGFLTENYSWRWVFYINLPFGILCAFGIYFYCNEYKKDEMKFDWTGFGLFSLFIGSLQLFLDRGNQEDWLESVEICIYLVIICCSFWMFIVHILTSKNPFITLSIFKDRNFKSGVSLMFLIGIILLATMALIPPLLQNLLNYPLITAGIVMVPRGLGVMMMLIVGGKLVQRGFDPRVMIFIGLSLIAYSLWEMTGMNLSSDSWIFIKTGLIQGFGLGITFVPLSTVTFATLDKKLRVEATGLYNLARNIGSAIGISIVSSVLSISNQENHSSLSENINSFNFDYLTNIFVNISGSREQKVVASFMDIMVNKEAVIISYLNCFKLMMWVIIIAAPFTFFLSSMPQKKSDKENNLEPVSLE